MQDARNKRQECESRIAELEIQLQSVNEQLEVISAKASDATLLLDNFKQALADRDDSHTGAYKMDCYLGERSLSAQA